jgi:hypothetical protein
MFSPNRLIISLGGWRGSISECPATQPRDCYWLAIYLNAWLSQDPPYRAVSPMKTATVGMTSSNDPAPTSEIRKAQPVQLRSKQPTTMGDPDGHCDVGCQITMALGVINGILEMVA